LDNIGDWDIEWSKRDKSKSKGKEGELSDPDTESKTKSKSKKPSKPGQMQKEVERNQAPKGVKRVDPPHKNNPYQQPHTHFDDDTAINMDGSPQHGTPDPSQEIIQWLLKHGWNI
jgi:hypothetical protein